ncbi:MAG: acyl carrier protein [Planctomycetota bacterium]|jgi:acyl carrier protein
MEKSEIIMSLSNIFKDVFSDSSIVITDNLTAKDVDEWDSLTHMLLIVEVEKLFGIKFKLKDLNKMKNVGDMVEIIQGKI